MFSFLPPCHPIRSWHRCLSFAAAIRESTFSLPSPNQKIGREAYSDIQLFDSEASRTHAEIRVNEEGKCELLDLGQQQRDQINGERVVDSILPVATGSRSVARC